METDYLWTTALFTGHATATAAFSATEVGCRPQAARSALAADGAAFAYTAAIDTRPAIDSPCLAKLAGAASWSVPLLHTAHDDATVFELIGPGTVHPHLRDLVGVPAAALHATATEWAIPADATLTQVSLGSAGASRDPAAGVAVDLLGLNGRWRTVAAAPGRVGDGGSAPFLLATLPAGARARAVRVAVGSPGPATLCDLHVLGMAAAGSGAQAVGRGRL